MADDEGLGVAEGEDVVEVESVSEIESVKDIVRDGVCVVDREGVLV